MKNEPEPKGSARNPVYERNKYLEELLLKSKPDKNLGFKLTSKSLSEDDLLRANLIAALPETEVISFSNSKQSVLWESYNLLKKNGYKKSSFSLVNKMHEVLGSEIKVSVIVPVYKVENYVSKCLESLIEQTLMNFEMIVINDGTPDNSAKIAEEYANVCPSFIHLHHKKNGGLGSARNAGLKYAKGEYIGYVDSDDYVDPTMFEKLYEKTKKGSDIVICSFQAINDEDEKKVWEWKIPGDIDLSNMREVVKNSTLRISPNAWNKLFKRQLLNKITWGKGFYEDLQATPTYLSYSKKISYVDEPLYFYRINREGSIMSTKRDDKRCLAFIEAWENLLKYSNPKYREEMIYSIYIHITDIVQAFPFFFEEYMNFFKRKREIFEENKLIKEDLDKGKLKNLFDAKLVPNILYEDTQKILEAEKRGLEEEKRGLEEEKRGLEEEKRGLEEEKRGLEEEKRGLEEERNSLKRRIKELESEFNVLNEEKEGLESSLSWRVTKPIRDIRKILK